MNYLIKFKCLRICAGNLVGRVARSSINNYYDYQFDFSARDRPPPPPMSTRSNSPESAPRDPNRKGKKRSDSIMVSSGESPDHSVSPVRRVYPFPGAATSGGRELPPLTGGHRTSG